MLYKAISNYLPLLIYILMIVVLVGCSGQGLLGYYPDQQKVIEPWVSLTGAKSGLSKGKLINLKRPVALGVRNNDIYLADKGLRSIFHYDHARQLLTPFASNESIEDRTSIYVATDATVYVAHPSSNEVRHFNQAGVPLRPLTSLGNLIRPIAIAEDERNEFILVADGQLNHIIVFDAQGELRAIIKPQQVKSIDAISIGPDGIYILDRKMRQVIVLRMDGSPLYTLKDNNITSRSSSLAVSSDNLIFVGDTSTHAIKIYQHRKLVTKIPIGGLGANAYSSVAALFVYENNLYAADSLNSRIQIMSINPGALYAGNKWQDNGILVTPNGEVRLKRPFKNYRNNFFAPH